MRCRGRGAGAGDVGAVVAAHVPNIQKGQGSLAVELGVQVLRLDKVCHCVSLPSCASGHCVTTVDGAGVDLVRCWIAG